jgi:uncharacterized membrane protein
MEGGANGKSKHVRADSTGGIRRERYDSGEFSDKRIKRKKEETK